MIYESNKYRFDFWSVSTARLFCDSIFNDKTIISEAEKKQSSLLNANLHFNSIVRPRSKAGK